ncbi:MAG: NAD(P)-dependent oxidoreductase [Conexibacteraceae bacterium]|nr:NAD(P)-dependent oxidoreductase [Conexibacteraceae bacterium]
MNHHGTVGFVGIGNAGWPMATNLVQAGFTLLVYDVDRERTERFAREVGAGAATELIELASVDTLFTMLPDGNVVRGILFGSERLAEQLAAGTVVIDTSSSDPEGTRALGADLAEHEIVLIDSAVSVPEVGGAHGARITFMVGADDEQALDRVRPLLEAMSEHVFHLGGLGAGHTMKTLNNYISAAGLYAALDALMIGFGDGLDPMTMLDVLNVSTGRNFSTEQTLKYHSLPRTFNTGYTLTLLVKDLRIAAAVAERAGFDGELFQLLVDGFDASVADLGDGDLTAALQHWEHRAGFELPASAPQPA